jgi:excisionase family DNA binding protein
MSKMFYTMEETMERLGVTEAQVREMVKEGRLREFRDAGQVNFKADEVDALSISFDSMAGASATGELVLEPADDSQISMASTGNDLLALDDTSLEKPDEDAKEGTKVTSVGISVFDEEDIEGGADPAAKTVLSPDESGSGSGSGLTGIGSGSGLLDLTRDSRDDTSLGADLLDEIYPGEESGGTMEMGDATRAGLSEAINDDTPAPSLTAMGALGGTGAGGTAMGGTRGGSRVGSGAPLEDFAAPASAGAPSRSAMTVPESDPLATGLTGMLLVTVLVMIVAGLASAAMIRGGWPGLLDLIYQKLWIFGAACAGAAVIALVVGILLGKRG